MAHLIVCLILDNDIYDSVLIGKACQVLLQLRMINPLLGLLRYVRRNWVDIQNLPNITTYYARLFEWMFDKMGMNYFLILFK